RIPSIAWIFFTSMGTPPCKTNTDDSSMKGCVS
ncbi:uncharacterized protein METZ01_LOCUS10406, partial [marine metagenome]